MDIETTYQDFLARIDKNSNNFSKNELKLAYLFREDLEHLLDLSIVDIAQQANVSKATVSRFIRKLGYDSFNEFRYSLQDMRKLKTGEHAIRQNIDFVDTLKQDYNILIDRATALINKNDLDYFVEKLVNSNSIYAAGLGNSGSSAKEMSNKFIHMGISIKPLEETSFIITHASTLKKNDLFIVFSALGESKQLLKAVQIAKDNHATVILITNFATSTISKFVDKTLLTAQKSDLQNNYTITPQFPQLFIIDLLFNAVIASNHKKYRKKIEELNKRNWKHLDVPINTL